MIPDEKRPRIVIAIMSGEVPNAKAARREKVSEQCPAVGRRSCARRQDRVDCGKDGPSQPTGAVGGAGRGSDHQVQGEAAVQIHVWKESAEGWLSDSDVWKWDRFDNEMGTLPWPGTDPSSVDS